MAGFFSGITNPSNGIHNIISRAILQDRNPELEEVVKKIVQEKKDFVKQKGFDAISPLMGEVMKVLRGKVDGKKINDILKKEIGKII